MGIKLVKQNDSLKILQQQMLKGDPGDSAYDIALEHGFEGTEAEWLESLKGETGQPGAPLTYEDLTPEQKEELKGKDGYTPQKGVDYFDGEPGKDGKTPVKGVDYFDGEPGKDGYTPVKGVDYFDGEPGAKGDPFEYEDFTEEQLAALKGEDGESGVYVGTTEPTDDSLIWINPIEAGAALATQEYVDSAIAAAIGVIENGTY